MSEMKQVIVMRKDLGMNKGKMIAQGAHAAMLHLLEGRLNEEWAWERIGIPGWGFGRMLKIVVGVDSLQELEDVVRKAKDVGLLAYMVTDSGRTVFKGEPTITCAAIGPNKSEDVDKITGHLKLL